MTISEERSRDKKAREEYHEIEKMIFLGKIKKIIRYLISLEHL